MKRFPGESTLEYRQRRRQDKIDAKLSLLGKVFFFGGTYRKKPAPRRTDRPRPISAAVGKRYKGESLEEFKARRMAANARRRQREKNRGLGAG